MQTLKKLIKNAKIINEGKIFEGAVLIEGQKIKSIFDNLSDELLNSLENDDQVQIIDASGKYLMPGVIDDQVHFRDPGLTKKADIATESRAAIAGGITSFMDMPNTVPNALTQEVLEEKYKMAATKSLANYSFYMGASNDNVEEVLKTDPKTVCGVKVFMGSSTGNMLVDNPDTLERLFAESPVLIVTHCEDEQSIRNKVIEYKEKYGEDIPVECHPLIRDDDACFKSSSYAIGLAKKHNSRLHVLHLTTAKEMSHFDNSIPLEEKRITAEVCVHHLFFCDEDYKTKGAGIKCNPAVKTKQDREALREALLDDRIDVIATDHAPHLEDEKQNSYFKCPAGVPLVQHALPMMLELHHQGVMSLETLVHKMCHAPAICYKIANRGYIREGYQADLTLVDLDNPWTVDKSNILYKCNWSPFEGDSFKSKVTHTFINGNLVYDNGKFDDSNYGQRLVFDR